MRNGRTPRAIVLALSLGIVIGACHSDAAQSPVTDGDPGEPPVPPTHQTPVTLDVLFIGNSLTYYNDLPATVAALASLAGDRIRVKMVAGPRQSLMNHLTPGSAAQAAILGGRWNVVVLQDGADNDLVSRSELILAAERFDTLVRSAGARPALYMVWPPRDEPDGFCESRVSYQLAAAAVKGVFLPAGVAWQMVLQRNPGLPLYDPDGGHPSPLGTYLAALTIYETLTGHDARQLGPRAVVDGALLNLPADTVQLLEGIAHTASSGGGPIGGCNVTVE